MTDQPKIPFKIATLIFLKNQKGDFLLLKRKKAPNKGCWSPIGGKLDIEKGESPFECAVRETKEETGFEITEKDLHLYGYISEKNFEGSGHWLMFMFDCTKPIPELPVEINEGHFEFFSREQIETIGIPPTDKKLVWPFYDKYSKSFAALRADCNPDRELEIIIEEISEI
jgi:8-oxo-dGTP diphosphatase